MKALTVGGVAIGALATVMEIDDPARAQQLARSLANDGLIEESDGFYRLSSSSK